MSAECIAFIKSLVVEDPDDRCSAAQALRLPWLAQDAHFLEADDREKVIRNLKRFSQSRKIAQTAMLCVALGMDDHLSDVRTFTEENCLPGQPKLSMNAFHSMDLDKTGQININEFCRALKEVYSVDEQEARELFQSVDQTNSETINYVEFLAATLTQNAIDEQSLKEAFARLDVRNSGKISVAGLLKVLKRSFDEAAIKEMINSADLTGDGCLSFMEFQAMFSEHPSNPNEVDITIS